MNLISLKKENSATSTPTETNAVCQCPHMTIALPIVHIPVPMNIYHFTQNLPVLNENIYKAAEYQITDNEHQSSKEESLESLPETVSCISLFKGQSYKNRNAYKTILRYIESYLRKNTPDITEVLARNGYYEEEVQKAIIKLYDYSQSERSNGNAKASQNLIKKMLAKKSIYSYILRESLYAIIISSNNDKLGRISKNNIKLYKEVSSKLYEEVVKLLGCPSQGTSFILS